MLPCTMALFSSGVPCRRFSAANLGRPGRVSTCTKWPSGPRIIMPLGSGPNTSDLAPSFAVLMTETSCHVPTRSLADCAVATFVADKQAKPANSVGKTLEPRYFLIFPAPQCRRRLSGRLANRCCLVSDRLTPHRMSDHGGRRVGRPPHLAVRRSIPRFYRVAAYGLERLVTVRPEIFPGLRVEEGLRLRKAFPFRDRDPLGRRGALQNRNLPASGLEVVTARALLRLRNAHCDISSELCIKRLEFANGVGLLRCGLGVQSLHGRSATHATHKCQCDCVFRFHCCSP